MRESEDEGRAGIGQLLEELCQWLAASTECSFAVLLLLCHEGKVYNKCWFKGSEAKEEGGKKN